MFDTFYCNFGRAEENRSSYRGLRYVGSALNRGFTVPDLLFQCFVLFCFVLFNLVLLSCLRPSRCLFHPFFVFLFQTNEQIKIVDSMIGRLWSGLKDRCLEDKINIILVSDHGKFFIL